MAINTSMLPFSYRAELLQSLMSDLRAGECCSLIGMEGTGKSNLGRFLERHDIQYAYWKDNVSWILLIDSHSLIASDEKSTYHFILLLIQCLKAEAEHHHMDVELLEWIDTLTEQFAENPGLLFAFQCLQNLCRRLCEQHGIQLAFVFEEFDDLWKTVDARFFLNLRSLRDQFKYQVVYLVITRERLQNLRQDLQAVEAFWELFSAHTYSLGPYSEDDANVMLERLALRAGIAKPDFAQELMRLSGRHAGLLRAIFWASRSLSSSSLTTENFLQISSVSDECAKIWNTFAQDEQYVMQIIAQNLPLQHFSPDALDNLRFKKALSGNPPVFFSPLFAAYVLQKSGNTLSGVVVDIRLRQVWIEGQPLQQNLAPLEFKLLEHLARAAGAVCKREDLLHALYNETSFEKFDQRLYAVLSRLREVLGESSQTPRYLITHRGGGIQLIQGSIINDDLN